MIVKEPSSAQTSWSWLLLNLATARSSACSSYCGRRSGTTSRGCLCKFRNLVRHGCQINLNCVVPTSKYRCVNWVYCSTLGIEGVTSENSGWWSVWRTFSSVFCWESNIKYMSMNVRNLNSSNDTVELQLRTLYLTRTWSCYTHAFANPGEMFH